MIVIACLMGLGRPAAAAEPASPLTGWTVAGGEFGPLPGRVGHDYIYPGDAELDYLVAQGMNVVRLPFRWERIQPRLQGELSSAESALLRRAVAAARRRGLAVILDVHNYARFEDRAIGSSDVTSGAFADLWRRLALLFRDDPAVVFGLMNEPHDLPITAWLDAANAAVAAIRSTGARQLVLVPGSSWTGAHSWAAGGAESNAVVMAGVNDPCGNVAYEVHQYFDADYSGTAPQCAGRAGAVAGLRSFTAWLRARGAKGFLGEFGVSSDASCAGVLGSALAVLGESPDSWIGWTAWAAGAWWAPDYPLSLQPRDGRDRPQVAALTARAARRPPPDLASCRP